jgi:hypothetical protein
MVDLALEIDIILSPQAAEKSDPLLEALDSTLVWDPVHGGF